MKTVEVKVSELEGVALDWAVFCAVYPSCEPTIRVIEEQTIERKPFINPVTFPRAVYLTYSGAYETECDWWPSTDWSQGGPLLDKHCKSFGLVQDGLDKTWRAFGYGGHTPDGTNRFQRLASGSTILIAACRAIVAAKLGDTVSIPAELA